MRTIAWETDSQITLRNLSKEVGECRYTYDFGEGVRAVRHTSPQKVSASQEKQMSLLMILVLF